MEATVKTSSKKRRTPFSISPNPLALFPTPGFESALFRARFCVNNAQGLNTVLADPGLGKSTLLRALHTEFDADPDMVSVLIGQPSFKSEYAMATALGRALGVPIRRSTQAQLIELEQYLAGLFTDDKSCIVLIDEAQLLQADQLELIRGLLNFETNEVKLINFVLAGQPEFKAKIEASRALSSRVIAPSVLTPLTADEVAGMIQKRCEFGKIENPFTRSSAERVFSHSGGVPRTALRVAGLAYEMARLGGITEIPAELVDAAALDMASQKDSDEQ
jgi:general secretion pathway protein A